MLHPGVGADIGHWLGLDNLNGPFYAWWSGAGSDISELAVLGGIYSIYRRHQCPVHHCWRLGKHATVDPAFVVCAKHHPAIPDDAMTAAQLHRHLSSR
ncbi:MAG: hypothetical protein ACRD6B_03945 [Bryobacteraceae bacterium]